jgi:hypothetical protein
MITQFLLAGFIMSVGIAIAAAGTYLYQWRLQEPAMLRYDGRTPFHMFGHLAMSFFCGPFIMLQMGWRQDRDGTLSISSALISAFVAFGWAFITGLMIVGTYVGLTG